MSETPDQGDAPVVPGEGSPPDPTWASSPGASAGSVPPAFDSSAPAAGPGPPFNPGARPTIAGQALAGRGRRFVGYFIDGLIFSVVYYPLSGLFSTTQTVLITTGGTSITTQARTVSPLYSLLFLIIGLAYYTLLWSRKGASLGQMAVGIRVVDATTGAGVSQTQALVRAIGYVISAIPLFLGFIWAFFDQRRQGWMDKMANTLVVDAPRF